MDHRPGGAEILRGTSGSGISVAVSPLTRVTQNALPSLSTLVYTTVRTATYNKATGLGMATVRILAVPHRKAAFD
jgi:hypothetical protein